MLIYDMALEKDVHDRAKQTVSLLSPHSLEMFGLKEEITKDDPQKREEHNEDMAVGTATDTSINHPSSASASTRQVYGRRTLKHPSFYRHKGTKNTNSGSDSGTSASDYDLNSMTMLRAGSAVSREEDYTQDIEMEVISL